MSTFNAPPGWPVPHGWSPSPDWSPDPSWPPAPAGWVFWVDNDRVGGVATGQRIRRWKLPLIPLSIMIILAVVVWLIAALSDDTEGGIRPLPQTPTYFPESGIRPDWPSPHAIYADFQTWSAFGGVDAQFTNQGTSVVLDTHDTTDTWRTKWSGLMQLGPSRCDLGFTGRVRSLSHTVGVPGGFGIGLATLEGAPDSAELTGTAIQFDFGARGIRTAIYPGDTDHGVVSAQLDNGWHEVEVNIDVNRHTLRVDGQTVADVNVGGQCGSAVLRVWAGSAEFADFSFA